MSYLIQHTGTVANEKMRVGFYLESDTIAVDYQAVMNRKICMINDMMCLDI